MESDCLTHYLLKMHNCASSVADILKTLWKIEHLLLRSKCSISHKIFKTTDINRYFVFKIIFSMLKIEKWRHIVNIV